MENKDTLMDPRLLSTPPKRLLREDWDFSRVPDHELPTCFLWECGREWKDLWEYSRYVGGPDDDLDFSHPEALKVRMAGYDLQKAWGVRGANALFQMLAFSGIETYTGAADSAPPQPAKPWQLFGQELRDLFVEQNNPGLRHIDSQTLRSYEKMAEAGGYELFEVAAGFLINWNETDNQLLTEFAAWLKRTRVTPARENRGSNLRDKLKMIGAMRLLHHYSFFNARTVSANVLGGKPLYNQRPSWERARFGALNAFHEHFFVDHFAFDTTPMPKSFEKYDGPFELVVPMNVDGLNSDEK